MKEKCNDELGCLYSKSMNQPYPRLCVNCGCPEESAIDHESIKILETPIISTNQLVEVFKCLQQRDLTIQNIKEYPRMQIEPTVEFIKEVNERIKQILNL